MEIKFCGGAYEVGASCILLHIGGKHILMDCGMRMNGDPLPNLDMIKQTGLDLILISHAHMDHIGSLPIISTEFPNVPIIMTHMTKELLRILLYDSLKIMDMKERESEIPIFSEIHVENMLNRILCYSPDYDIYPFQDDTKITMYGAGHIPGAVLFYIVTKEGSVFYSGDFSITPQMAVGAAALPKLKPDVAIFESTYGNRLHSNREQELLALLHKIVEIVESGHKILIPAFALGRAQEILLYINNAVNKKQCQPFRIYVDGMVNDICRAFLKYPNYLRDRYTKKVLKNMDIFYNEYVVAVPKNMAARKEMIEKKEGACIIASSGMLTGGPSAFYAANLCGNENNYIALTGYQDEESPGAKLLELIKTEKSSRTLKLNEGTYPVNCGIGIFGLSAHADKSQILAMAHMLMPNQTFFVHGNTESVNEIASSFQKECSGKVDIPQNGECFSLDYTKNKRFQIQKETLHCMKGPLLGKKTTPLQDIKDSDLEPLWEFILQKYTNKKGFTIEEIAYILTGSTFFEEDELILFYQIIYASKYFVSELKRPYIIHANLPEEIKKETDSMEVNQALSLAEEMFSPFGLYKKGAKQDEKKIVLYFNFPAVDVKKAGEEISKFEELSKWNVITNDEIHVTAAIECIEALLPKDIQLLKTPSYHRVDGCFRISVSQTPSNYREIEEEFFEKTGVCLYFNQAFSQPVIPKKEGKQMEQNAAFSAIEAAFLETPDKLYKKSLKADAKGGYIELTFITPEIGILYKERIQTLEKELSWRILIANTVNQNEIFKLGKGILERNDFVLKKNMSYLPDKKMFTAQVISAEKGNVRKAQEEFYKKTGLLLEIL